MVGVAGKVRKEPISAKDLERRMIVAKAKLLGRLQRKRVASWRLMAAVGEALHHFLADDGPEFAHERRADLRTHAPTVSTRRDIS